MGGSINVGRGCFLAALLLSYPAVIAGAQPIDPGLSAHEQARRAQSQGLVVAPPVTLTAPNPAQPALAPGALYHSQVVDQQRNPKPLLVPHKKKDGAR